MATETDIRVVDNPSALRYELHLGDAMPGFLAYALRDRTITLIHTEIDQAYEGQGLGSRLIAAVLEDVRAKGLRMIPMCPFVRAYLERHPQ